LNAQVFERETKLRNTED
jgi:chromosome segregation ATPase